jgi:hypothetical protein
LKEEIAYYVKIARMAKTMKGRLLLLLIQVLVLTALACLPGAFAADAKEKGLPFPYIDGHNHLLGQAPSRSVMDYDYEGAVRMALSRMDAFGIEKTVILPHPFGSGQPFRYDFGDFLRVLRKYPGRFAFMGGGGTLNVIINRAFREGMISDEMRTEFEKESAEIVSSGAIGFGEMSAEHLSLGDRHPYQSTAPDHPLFLLLSDIAAKNGMVIDIHMEAVSREMPVPARLRSPHNPKTLRPNIEALERLLAHNRATTIIWAHAGWDNTGDRTVSMMATLLRKYPNLFMSIKIGRDSLPENRPVDEKGIKPEWLELVRDFPDRFIVGSDEFFISPRITFSSPPRLETTHRFLSLLPQDLAYKVGYENPNRIFKLKR